MMYFQTHRREFRKFEIHNSTAALHRKSYLDKLQGIKGSTICQSGTTACTYESDWLYKRLFRNCLNTELEHNIFGDRSFRSE